MGDEARNPELELALRFLRETDVHLFLTGRAGTGKTTFLRGLGRSLRKEFVVAAPTGVAAINAGGITLHSLFQLPFKPVVVDYPELQARSAFDRLETLGVKAFRKRKRQLLQRIELLVIDEVSMLRADYLDAIDVILRTVRRDWRPFGGVQLLLIGDLYQLPPVVGDEEREILRPIYDTPFFFSAQSLRQCGYYSLELRHVYRQRDPAFVELLNHVRVGERLPEVLHQLNARYPGHPSDPVPGQIVLMTHNAQADAMNASSLKRLPGESFVFSARIEGDFSARIYPTDQELRLKVGAQVMFIRNDTTGRARYFNGRIGQVVHLNDRRIEVELDDGQRIDVQPETWENMRYEYNPQTGRVEEEVLGSFRQYPLRLAWAITIHKSQGLSFDRVLIDGARAFASGQVYVALSRCRSLEGIVLNSPLPEQSIQTDPRILAYSRDCSAREPSSSDLTMARHAYELRLLLELFSYQEEEELASKLQRLLLRNPLLCSESNQKRLRAVVDFTAGQERILSIFRRQIQGISAQQHDLEPGSPLHGRVGQGVAFLLQQLESGVLDTLSGIVPERLDGQEEELFNALRLALRTKLQCLRAALGGFSIEAYCTARVMARIEGGGRSVTTPRGDPHLAPDALEHELRRWRMERAAELGLSPNRLLSTPQLRAILNARPCDVEQLAEVPGVGPQFIQRHGWAIVDLVRRMSSKSPRSHAGGRSRRSPISSSHLKTLALLREGLSVEEVAEARGLTLRTIRGHVNRLVRMGQLDGRGL